MSIRSTSRLVQSSETTPRRIASNVNRRTNLERVRRQASMTFSTKQPGLPRRLFATSQPTTSLVTVNRKDKS